MHLLLHALAAPRICCTMHLLHYGFAAHRTCCTPHLLHTALAAPRTCCTQHLLYHALAAPRTCCTTLLLRHTSAVLCIHCTANLQHHANPGVPWVFRLCSPDACPTCTLDSHRLHDALTLQAGRLSRIAIDEAHCCSQWGGWGLFCRGSIASQVTYTRIHCMALCRYLVVAPWPLESRRPSCIAWPSI
jgi:hypothetical protein